eukprot:scaffold291488_cov18-Tisochrysis_lutea.AAC.1
MQPQTQTEHYKASEASTDPAPLSTSLQCAAQLLRATKKASTIHVKGRQRKRPKKDRLLFSLTWIVFAGRPFLPSVAARASSQVHINLPKRLLQGVVWTSSRRKYYAVALPPAATERRTP